ncbi:MAG: hypothetical protein ABUT20_02465 [Bacteroidota bacterium]
MKVLFDFLQVVSEDSRISAAHIAVYVALLKLWKDKDFMIPLFFFRHELVATCKISSTSTFHRVIRELQEYGYIKYQPSFSNRLGSRVEFVMMKRG